MASVRPKDWFRLDLDPVKEIKGSVIARKPERKLKEFNAARVTFFQNLLLMVECLMPACWGHRKYGVVTEENLPVVFRRHEKNGNVFYVPYKNSICLPMRMPENGDVVLSGVKWSVQSSVLATSLLNATSTIFDCFVANLRFRMLTKRLCLECLFMHTNGMGLIFERYLKTILNHLVFYGRYEDNKPYVPISKFNSSMEFKIKRIWWGFNDKCFKHVCYESNVGFKENVVFRPESWLNNGLPDGTGVCPDQGILRWLNTISKIIVTVKCGCNGGAYSLQNCYVGLLRKGKRSVDLHNIVLAKWDVNGDEYEDPLWNFSLYGSRQGSLTVTQLIPKPICSTCPKCDLQINMHNILVPETTWLFMADMAEIMQKRSVANLKKIAEYTIDGVEFYLAFILLYNTRTGDFTSINTFDMWRFFDDSQGGIFKYCNPKNTDYKDRWNVRAFYYRSVNFNPHRCLMRAAKNS